MSSTAPPASLNDLGVLTLTELAERTGVPRQTLVSWTHNGHMHFIKIDGVKRSTVAEVHRVADTVQGTNRRSWELEPLPESRPERLEEVAV